MNSIPTLRYSSVLIAAAFIWSASPARAIGFPLSESKEQLKLKYDLSVTQTVIDEDRGTVLVTVVLTLADEGRLKPLDEVELIIPSRQPFKDGGYGADLVVWIDMKKTNDGKRVGRVQFLREFAERAEIQFNTHTLDGKFDGLTRLHHVIPIAKHLSNPPATPAKPAAPANPPAPTKPPVVPPPATEGKR